MTANQKEVKWLRRKGVVHTFMIVYIRAIALEQIVPDQAHHIAPALLLRHHQGNPIKPSTQSGTFIVIISSQYLDLK